MSDIVVFLRARIDEDERRAPAEHFDIDEGGYYSCPATRDEPYGDLPSGEEHCNCGLAQRRARALQEVAAKRALLAEVERELADDDTNETAQWMARVLAAVYADHPDYDPAWAPNATP